MAVADNYKLLFSVSSETGLLKRISANKNIETLNSYFQKYPETEKIIASQFTKGKLYAIGYTETPLIFIDDHFERQTRTIQTEAGNEHMQGYFTLCSAIIRTDEQNNLGEYTYYGLTTGEWTKHSIIGGTNYPASGYDNVVQVVSPDMIRGDHEMVATYTNAITQKPVNGTEGQEFYAVPYAITDNMFFANYMIKDDPFGLQQLSSFILATEYFCKPANSSRTLYGIYTHTWKQMDIDISIEFEDDLSFTPPNSIGLSFERRLITTPEYEDKSWLLESSVTFSF